PTILPDLILLEEKKFTMNRQRNSYTVEEKRKAVELVLCTSNLYAARFYSLDLTMNGLAVNYPNIKSKMAKILDENWAKAEFHSGNTDLAVIPRDLMSMCQPLDVCINKPFKNQLHKIWHKWIADSSNSITIKENLKHATFKRCDISNCLLGSKDYLIYTTDDELDEDEIEDFDDVEEENNESDSDESDSDESDSDESDSDEFNNRVGK
ncbi:46448_t:CDS:2, partial [Gigaspora margarita]